jgi:hypothetical protein
MESDDQLAMTEIGGIEHKVTVTFSPYAGGALDSNF